jgi:hypothetical protein
VYNLAIHSHERPPQLHLTPSHKGTVATI